MRSRVSSGLSYVYNFPALDPSLVLYYPLDTSANINGGFTTPNFASRLPVYDASLAGSSMITYNPGTFITSIGDLSLNNTMGSQLVAQTASGNYVVCNNTVALNISGGFSISLWFSCSGQLNTRGTLFALPYNKTGNGFEIDVSGTNMIYTGYNVPIPSPIDSLSASAKTAMLYSGTRKQAGALGVKLLYSGYTGPTIRIKNGSGGTPTDFYADAAGNLGTAYLGTGTSLITQLGAANPAYYVVTWYDQTGNGNHGTGAGTPIYDTTNKTVKFGTGSGDGNGYFTLPDSAFPTGNSNYTYILTPKNFNYTGTYTGFFSGGTPGGNQIHQFYNNPGVFAIYSSWYDSGTTYIANVNNSKIAVLYNSTNSPYYRYFYVNGTIVNTTTYEQRNSRNQQPSNNYFGSFGSSNIYNGTFDFFYWAPVELSAADCNVLSNT